MDKIAGSMRKFWLFIIPFVITIGFLGMGLVCFDLIRSLISLFVGTSTATVGVVLPVQAKGVLYVPFIYWIICIFAILIVHEGMHGVMARALKMKVKNSGLIVLGALAPIIPGAFVEPDENELAKASMKKQLAVYAAGPFANLVCAGLFALVFFTIFTPLSDTFYENKIVVTDMMGENSPAELAGIVPGDIIQKIDSTPITDTLKFSEAIQSKDPGDSVSVITANAMYDIQLLKNPDSERAWFGVYVEQPLIDSFFAKVFIWFKDLFFWLFILNFGVGLFNLVPLGPIDGGRMLLTVLEKFTHKTKAAFIWKTVSFSLLGILVTNVVIAFI